jgi:hypothetical protein
VLLLSVLLLSQLPADYAGHCGTSLFPPPQGASLAPVKLARPALDHNVGDQDSFWLSNLSVMPPQQMRRSATVRGKGSHCYVWVEDSSWNAGHMDSADVAFIVEHFDHLSVRDSTKGVWQWNTGSFGMPPDVDNDSLVNLMYYNIGTFHGYSFDGFWYFYDEYPDSIAYPQLGYHSNEMEVVYIDDYPNNPGTDYRVAIVAHEFEHMIHFNYDPAEELWVNEGAAELAMWLYGSPDRISEFNTAPNNDLTDWTGSWGDYIQTYLFFLYMYEQYGERVGEPLIKTIVQNPLTNTAGIDSSLAQLGISQTYRSVFTDWVVANYMRDTIPYGGRYGYYGEQVPAFTLMRSHTTYPVDVTSFVYRWAAVYARFRQGSNLNLGLNGADNGAFKAQVVARDTVNRTFVLDSILLDPLQAGQITIPGFGTTYQEVILIPTNVNPYPYDSSFNYTATATGIEENPGLLPARVNLTVSPRRGNLLVSYFGRQDGIVKLRLYSSAGRLAGSFEAKVKQGLNLFSLNLAGTSAGAYFLAAAQGTQHNIAKLAIVK